MEVNVFSLQNYAVFAGFFSCDSLLFLLEVGIHSFFSENILLLIIYFLLLFQGSSFSAKSEQY